MERLGQYVLSAASAIVEARLSDVSLVIRAHAMVSHCNLRNCTIRVEANGLLEDCAIEECDTTLEIGAEEGRNYVEGGSWLDLNRSSEVV